MKLTRPMALVGAALLAFGLSSCAGSSAPAEGENYVLAYGSEPQNPLLPAGTNENGGGRLLDLLFSGLVGYRADGTVYNEVADSIELEGDRTYRITLKDGWLFSDGSPVTADSFVKAWNYAVANDELQAPFFEPIKGYAPGARELTGLTVIDDLTFTVELTQPTADFPQRLGYHVFSPLPEVAFEDMAAFGENPVGNGPYELAEWNHNQDALLVPNDTYAGERAARNDGVRFTFYPQLDGAYNDLLAGNLDVLESVPDSALSTFEQDLGSRSFNEPVATFQSITIPENLEHFRDDEEGELRRRALSLAINREEVTETIFQGTRTPAQDFTSPVVEGYDPSGIDGSEILGFDPEQAKELWARADDISPFSGEFHIAYNADGGHQAWADAVANSVSNVLGIDALGYPYPDFKSLRDDITSGTIGSAFRTGWQADYPGLGNFLTPTYATDGSSNDGGYSNPEFDALLKKADQASSVAESAAIFNQAQAILFRDLPAIPLWNSNATGGYSANVDHVVMGWNGLPEYSSITKVA